MVASFCDVPLVGMEKSPCAQAITCLGICSGLREVRVEGGRLSEFLELGWQITRKAIASDTCVQDNGTCDSCLGKKHTEQRMRHARNVFVSQYGAKREPTDQHILHLRQPLPD